MLDASPVVCISFWEYFQRNYAQPLKEIDLVMKTFDAPVSAAEAAVFLQLHEETVYTIMARNDIKSINRAEFLQIMLHGDSEICRLLQRECACGSPICYSPLQIAYIYGLQPEYVCAVCREYGRTCVPASEVPVILDRVFIYLLYPA